MSAHSLAQRDLTPGKNKKNVFGGAGDFNEYRPLGIQISVGPTFMLTRKVAITQRYDLGARPFDIATRPHGLPGLFLEVGMLHLPKKRSKLSQKLKYIFVSYYDWGLGFKLLGGEEFSDVKALDPITNQPIGTASYTGKFYNGLVYGRATAHKNIYFLKKYFVDNGLGLNFDYNIKRSNEASSYTATMLSIGKPHYFHKPSVFQLHYELGLGMKLNRRSMLVLSAQTPILGFMEWRGGPAALKWFDSNYQPLMVKFKWTYLFEKKIKGCAPARVNDQDNNTNKSR